MRVVAKGLVLLGLMAIAGLAFASDGADQSSPFLIASTRVSPEYPPAAQAARWEGTVVLAAQVRADGTVGEIEVLDSTHPNLGFEQSAMNAMKQWRFDPAQTDGVAVEAVSMFRLAFKIPGTRSRNFPYVAGEQLISKLAPPGVAASVSSFNNDSNRLAYSPGGQRGLVRMKLPPVQFGELYDRRDLFPSPPTGRSMPNQF